MESTSHRARPGPGTALVVLGALFIVIGGLVAAVTGPLNLLHGSWLAAYLVLVCGVAQFAIGTMQGAQTHSRDLVPRRWGWAQLVCLNLGNAAVVVGTLTRQPLVVDVAVVLLVVAFGIALHAVRPWATRASQLAVPGVSAAGSVSVFLVWLYRIFLVLLVVSLPVGSILAHLRAA